MNILREGFRPVSSSTNKSGPEYEVRKQLKIILIIAIVTTIAVAVLALYSFFVFNGYSNDNYQSETYKIEYVSSTYEQDPTSGDVTLHVTYSNTGDTTLTRNLQVFIPEPSGIVYSNSMKITMAPGETTAFDITVDTPSGTEVTNEMIQSFIF
jgi:uncharacterized protein YpmB